MRSVDLRIGEQQVRDDIEPAAVVDVREVSVPELVTVVAELAFSGEVVSGRITPSRQASLLAWSSVRRYAPGVASVKLKPQARIASAPVKCAPCCGVIQAGDTAVFLDGDLFHRPCWRIIVSNARIEESVKLQYQSRDLIEATRAKYAAGRRKSDAVDKRPEKCGLCGRAFILPVRRDDDLARWAFDTNGGDLTIARILPGERAAVRVHLRCSAATRVDAANREKDR